MAVPDLTPLPDTDSELFARFIGKVDITEGCWLWNAGTHTHGYGVLGVGPKTYYGHRLAWTFFVGPIPDGLCVLHNCPGGDNPLCCRPSHLFLGTHADNMADMAAKGRSAAGERNGARRHPEAIRRGAANGNARLTEKAVREMRRMGGNQRQIAERFGVHESTVSLVLGRRTWRHVR